MAKSQVSGAVSVPLLASVRCSDGCCVESDGSIDKGPVVECLQVEQLFTEGVTLSTQAVLQGVGGVVYNNQQSSLLPLYSYKHEKQPQTKARKLYQCNAAAPFAGGQRTGIKFLNLPVDLIYLWERGKNLKVTTYTAECNPKWMCHRLLLGLGKTKY